MLRRMTGWPFATSFGSPFMNDEGSWSFAGGPEASGGTAVRGTPGMCTCFLHSGTRAKT